MQNLQILAASIPDYVMHDERAIAALIVHGLLERGYRLSVFDGEAWTVRRSTDGREVCAALGTTEADVIAVRDQDGIAAGSLTLIWGNGNALLSDWSQRVTGGAGALFGMAMEALEDEIDARFL